MKGETKNMRKMRQLSSLFIAVCLILGLTACGNSSLSAENSSSSSETNTDVQESGIEQGTETSVVDAEPDTGTDVLVAYFTATGNTKAVAEQIAGFTEGELYEIVPADPYTEEDLDYGNDQSRTSQEMDDMDARPEIGSEEIAMDRYTTLYLGYPIWHGQAPRIMNTFVEHYNFDGLTVIPFCTSGGSGIGFSAETLEGLAGSGNWLEGERFASGVTDDEVQSWIGGLQG